MKHDHSYKNLFSHPEMVADLLRGFVHEEWVAQLDFTTLERMNGSYVAEDLRERQDDLIWLGAGEQASLRRAFTVWLKRVFLPGRMPGVEITEVQDLQEVKRMLAERVIEWTREWENQGIKKGREEGHKEGRKEGEAAVLLKQIELKFGSVAVPLREEIKAATTEQLEKWAEKILTATTLEEMFGKR